jgi:hypothetical protein
VQKPCSFLLDGAGQTLASDVGENRQQAATTPSYNGIKNKFATTEINLCPTAAAGQFPPTTTPSHPAKRIVLTRQQDLHGGSSWNGHSTPRQQGMFLQHICIIYPSAAVVGTVATGQRGLEIHTVLKTHSGFFKFGKPHVKVLLPDIVWMITGR